MFFFMSNMLRKVSASIYKIFFEIEAEKQRRPLL